MTIRNFGRAIRGDLARLVPAGANGAPAYRLVFAFFSPRFAPVFLIRLAQYFGSYRLTRPIALLFSLLNVILFGIECTPRCDIGPGLFLPHTSGTVIGAVKVGSNVTIYQGVTLGAKQADLGFREELRPIVGDRVVLGAGAKVLGGVRIGDGAVVSANSLVLDDVPPGALVMGVPAVIRRTA